LPAEILRALKFGDPAIADLIEVTGSLERADYELGTRVRGGVAEYAWLRPEKSVGGSNPPAPDRLSLLPSSTEWLPRGSDPATLAARLRETALRLSTIRNWLQLESPADAGTFPYHLALKQEPTGQLRTDGPTKNRDAYGLVLSLDPAMPSAHVDRRYVYVFTVDSEGKSQLLFPLATGGNVENVFPPPTIQAGQLPKQIQLGRSPLFTFDPGVTTFILLTTATALPDPTILEGAGVRGNTRGLTDPLSQLLAQGGGRRDITLTTPANWSIERITVATGKN